jgi:protein arginine kinase activator
MDLPEHKSQKKKPERPLECSECRRPIAVIYTEIVGDLMTQTSMCAECPELQKRLKGVPHELKGISQEEVSAGVACGNCGTTLEAVKMGSLLGCSNCYEVFGEIVLAELKAAENLPHRLIITNKSTPIHIGRIPGEILEITPSLRLLALNEALNETLKREDYEQAAILRDQIKELTETESNHDAKKRRKPNS